MDAFRKVSVAQLSIAVGVIITIMWVAVPGTAALVVSIAGGGLIALRSTMDGDADPPS